MFIILSNNQPTCGRSRVPWHRRTRSVCPRWLCRRRPGDTSRTRGPGPPPGWRSSCLGPGRGHRDPSGWPRDPSEEGRCPRPRSPPLATENIYRVRNTFLISLSTMWTVLTHFWKCFFKSEMAKSNKAKHLYWIEAEVGVNIFCGLYWLNAATNIAPSLHSQMKSLQRSSSSVCR